MENPFLFIYDDNQTFAAVFQVLPFSESLPFPLNADLSTKVLFTIYLISNLLLGGMLRSKILAFTKSLSIRENPINLFIWYDQLTGVFMGLNIIYTLTVMYLPFPLASIIGEAACNWTDLLGTLYLISQSVWSCFIAVYRLVYIKFQRILDIGIKKSNFAFMLSLLGYFGIITLAVFFAYYDKGILYKLCTHNSSQKIQILTVSFMKDFCLCLGVFIDISLYISLLLTSIIYISVLKIKVKTLKIL